MTVEFHHKFLAGAGAVVLLAAMGTAQLASGSQDGGTTVVGAPLPASTFAAALPSVATLGDPPTSGVDLGAAPTLAQALPKLELFVEQTRGRRFKHQVAVTPLADKDFLTELRVIDGPQTPVPGWDATLTALRLVPATFDFSKLNTAEDSDVGGVYDSTSKRLFVRSAVLDPLAQSILAHELTHALDDQYNSLDDLYKNSENGDEDLAIESLVEGDARWVEDQFLNALTNQRRTQEDAEAKALFGPRVGTDVVPAALQDRSDFPYDTGSDFVQNLRNAGGAAAVDKAFVDPPSSTLQIIDESDDYQHRVDPVTVTEPGTAAGIVLDSGTLGVELLSSLVGGVGASLGMADPGLGHWAGDAYETVRNGDQTCVRDTVESQDGGRGFLEDSLTDVPGAKVTVTGPNSLLFVSCVG